MNSAWSVFWKEYREQHLFWLGIALLAIVIVAGTAAAMSPAGIFSVHHDERLRSVLINSVLVLTAAYSVVCGALLIAGEREAGTDNFLDGLPMSRTFLWSAKAAMGLALILSQALLMYGLSMWFELPRGLRSPFEWLAFLILLALEAYAWSLCAAGLCRSVLATAGLTVLFLFAGWSAAIVLSVVIPESLEIWRLLLVVGGFYTSQRIWCAPDRYRRKQTAPVTVAMAPASWRVLTWLAWRQGRVQIGICIAAGLILGFFLPWYGLWLWPPATMVAGVVCGTQVFSQDQASQAYRYLGRQRLPIFQLWLVKMLFWLAIATAAGVVLMIGGLLALLVTDAEQTLMTIMQGELWFRLSQRGVVSEFIHPFFFLTAWGVYGFTLGMVFSLVLPKQILALFAAMVTSVLTLGLWLPTLICQGLSAWQLYAIPLLLVVTSFGSMRPWLGERLSRGKPLFGLIACGVLVVGWIAGNLWYRAVSVSDLGEPFDVSAYYQELSQAERNESAALIRDALREMKELEKKVTAKFEPHKKPGAPDEEGGPQDGKQAPVSTIFDQLFEVQVKGWPKKKTKLDPWLDEMFAGAWVEKLSKAAKMPPGLLIDPRRTTLSSVFEWLNDARLANPMLVARASQLQSRGEIATALEHLLTALRLSRHFRHHTDTNDCLMGWHMEKQALDTLENWLPAAKSNPRLLHQALNALLEHEKKLPDPKTAVKVEYLKALNSDFIDPFAYDQRPYKLARQAPWEKEHTLRIFWLGFHFRFENWNRPLHRSYKIVESKEKSKRVRYHVLQPDEYFYELGPDAREYFMRHGVQDVRDVLKITWYNLGDENLRRAYGQSLYRLRAAQIKTAAALYEIEHGRPIENLRQLTPKYLPAIPVNPFTNQPFETIPPRLEYRAGL